MDHGSRTCKILDLVSAQAVGRGEVENLGKLLLVTGLVFTSLGILVLVLSRVSNMVKLPGDIQIQTEGFSCVLPLATTLPLSCTSPGIQFPVV